MKRFTLRPRMLGLRFSLILGAGLATVSGAAVAAPKLQPRSAVLQCLDRRIVVDADCFAYTGATMMCTRQTLRFFDVGGKALGQRDFPPLPKEKGEDYPMVEAQFGELSCVESQAGDKLVTATMSNGGNCEQCEWTDVYTPDGKLLGSTRAGAKKGASQPAIVDEIRRRGPKRVLKTLDLTSMYAAQAPAAVSAPVPAPASFPACPVTNPQNASDEQYAAVLNMLNAAFNAAIGPDAGHLSQSKVLARVAAGHADEGRMAALAEAAGCAALLDEHSSCSQYFDPELGDPLSIFMGMKKSAPMRKQFEAAVARVADPNRRRAAQHCIKLVGKP